MQENRLVPRRAPLVLKNLSRHSVPIWPNVYGIDRGLTSYKQHPKHRPQHVQRERMNQPEPAPRWERPSDGNAHWEIHSKCQRRFLSIAFLWLHCLCLFSLKFCWLQHLFKEKAGRYKCQLSDVLVRFLSCVISFIRVRFLSCVISFIRVRFLSSVVLFTCAFCLV